jgi:hypothetical protein
MNAHVLFALAHPVFNPETEILPGHHWVVAPLVTAGLTLNIGYE